MTESSAGQLLKPPKPRGGRSAEAILRRAAKRGLPIEEQRKNDQAAQAVRKKARTDTQLLVAPADEEPARMYQLANEDLKPKAKVFATASDTNIVNNLGSERSRLHGAPGKRIRGGAQAAWADVNPETVAANMALRARYAEDPSRLTAEERQRAEILLARSARKRKKKLKLRQTAPTLLPAMSKLTNTEPSPSTPKAVATTHPCGIHAPGVDPANVLDPGTYLIRASASTPGLHICSLRVTGSGTILNQKLNGKLSTDLKASAKAFASKHGISKQILPAPDKITVPEESCQMMKTSLALSGLSAGGSSVRSSVNPPEILDLVQGTSRAILTKNDEFWPAEIETPVLKPGTYLVRASTSVSGMLIAMVCPAGGGDPRNLKLTGRYSAAPLASATAFAAKHGADRLVKPPQRNTTIAITQEPPIVAPSSEGREAEPVRSLNVETTSNEPLLSSPAVPSEQLFVHRATGKHVSMQWLFENGFSKADCLPTAPISPLKDVTLKKRVSRRGPRKNAVKKTTKKVTATAAGVSLHLHPTPSPSEPKQELANFDVLGKSRSGQQQLPKSNDTDNLEETVSDAARIAEKADKKLLKVLMESMMHVRKRENRSSRLIYLFLTNVE